MSKPRFRDIEQVRSDLKSSMPLHEFIELVDGASLERVNDELYKKKCDLHTHPVDADGSRDSTASFTVCPQKELWYCFGCGSGGDRIQYIETKFNMDHIDAIYKVAEVQGFDLSQYYAEYSDEEKAINQLFDENSRARDIAHNCLLNTPRAIEYLTGRGISLESIKEFKLGYVPPITENKVVIFDQIPNSKSLQLDKADRLSDAILFPVTDTTGRMRYFQSRPFNPATGQKYLGVSDKHPLYSEEDRLYGFHIARRKVREYGGRLVGVEGAPDTIVCNQHGVPAAGIMGTAANINTFALLDRFKIPELVLLLDGDKAGRSRSVSIAEKYLTFKTNVRLKIATLPDGLDPDETINKHGVDIIHKCVNEAKHAIEFIIDHLWHSKDYSGFTGKIDFVTEVYKYISVLTDPIIKKVAISHIAGLVGFDIVEIEDHYTRASAQTSGAILYNVDGEELIMAEMLRNQDFAIDMFSKFIKDDWYLARHKALFQLLKTAKHADIESLFVLAKNNNLDNIITQDWLNRLTNKYGNVEFAVDDVYDKLIRRRAKERLVKIDSELNDMTQKPALIIDQGIGQLYNATIKQTEESIFDAGQQVNDTMRLINERMKNPMMKIGYDLGPNFKKLTSALLGVQTKTLTVVSANQSVGKCVAAGTRVFTEYGYQKIENIMPDAGYGLSKIEITVPTRYGDKITSHFWKEEMCTVKHFKLSNGTEVNGTNDHRILAKTNGGCDLIKMGDLNIGDTLIFNEQPLEYGRYYDPEVSYCIGAWIGNGSYNSRTGTYWMHDQRPHLLKRIHDALASELTMGNILDESNEDCLRVHLGKSKNNILCNMSGCTARNKYIPDEMFMLSLEDRRALVQGLIDTDGNITNTGYEFSTSSEQLKNDFVDMCHSIGIIPTVIEKHVSRYDHTYYRVFLKRIVGKIWHNGLKDNEWKGPSKFASSPKPIKIIDIYETIEDVYDLTVPDGHEFIAQGLANHNTQIVENWVMHFSVNDGIPTLWISLEMDAVRMTFRHLAMLSGLDLRGIQTGNISVDNKTKILDPVAMKLANAPFYISERGHDIDEALAIARRYVTRFGVKVIAVDYIQLQYISSGKYAHQRHRELGMMSKSWKQFAKEMDVAVILISQLSKDALSADIAKAEHGAGSYEIAQDADNYITLKEKDSDEIEQNGIERGNITLNVDKNRMGEADILIDIYSQRENQRMKEV